MFTCDKCSLCCKRLHRSEIYRNLHNGNGICKFLKGNECSIYNTRPLVCRVDESYSVFFKDRMSYEEYLELTYNCCELLKSEEV